MSLTTVDQGLLGTYAQYTGFKNRLINGQMQIDQRNAGASLTTNGAYSLDRWFFETSNTNNNTIQKVADAPAGFYNSLKVTTTTGGSLSAGSYLDFSQVIEGFNVADLAYGSASAAPVTVSFWVKSSVTGTYSVCLRMPSAGTPVGSVQTITINSANTWEYESVTFTGNTSAGLVADNSAQLRLYILLAAGSTYQTSSSNTWVSANGGYNALNTQTNGMLTTTGATFYITGVQLEKGSTATSFDYRPYGTELALCQRYYYQYAKGNSAEIGIANYYTSSSIDVDGIGFPVTMRSIPSLVATSGVDYYVVYRNGAGDGLNSFTLAGSTTTTAGSVYNNTEASGTAGQVGHATTNNASASIAFSAEL